MSLLQYFFYLEIRKYSDVTIYSIVGNYKFKHTTIKYQSEYNLNHLNLAIIMKNMKSTVAR